MAQKLRGKSSWIINEDEFRKWKWRLLDSDGSEIDACSVGCSNRTYCVRCAKRHGYRGT
jgi:hypothetical protein